MFIVISRIFSSSSNCERLTGTCPGKAALAEFHIRDPVTPSSMVCFDSAFRLGANATRRGRQSGVIPSGIDGARTKSRRVNGTRSALSGTISRAELDPRVVDGCRAGIEQKGATDMSTAFKHSKLNDPIRSPRRIFPLLKRCFRLGAIEQGGVEMRKVCEKS